MLWPPTTKTSQWFIQLWGSGPSFSSSVFYVFITRLVNLFSHLIFVAIILSLVSLVLMALLHLALIIALVCCAPHITLSHLRTYIRWVALVSRIVASLHLSFLWGLF